MSIYNSYDRLNALAQQYNQNGKIVDSNNNLVVASVLKYFLIKYSQAM